MSGTENLEGRDFNGLRVVRMVSRRPVVWEVQCIRCNSHWNESHSRVRYATCRNNNCGHAPSEPRTTIAQTGKAVTATRSRDSESARQFQNEQTKQPVIRWAQPNAETFAGADPDSLRHYIESMEGK